MGALRGCFARTQTWQQAGKYISALASELPRCNGWTMAEHARDRSPDRMQRLLNRASWDAMAVMSEVRRFATAGLEAAARHGRRRGGLVIAAIDETGQQKTGTATAGLKRQYLGCAGRVANGITTVHVSLVRVKTGHALVGARQWIPREQVADPVKSLVTDAQAPPHVTPGQAPPRDPGMIPLTAAEVRRLLAAAVARHHPEGHAVRWLAWRRRHQARSRWFHQRTRVNREYALISWPIAAALRRYERPAGRRISPADRLDDCS
jgi:DDE superfamily endonuclease